ncbi:hypothetical protein ACH5RR_038826, partial [Cinchona calisaya]
EVVGTPSKEISSILGLQAHYGSIRMEFFARFLFFMRVVRRKEAIMSLQSQYGAKFFAWRSYNILS